VSRKPNLIAATLAAGVLSTGRVDAAPGDATRLEYARSARASVCPDRSTLQAQVSQRLGYDPFFHAARQTISVEIVDVDDEFHAQMRLMDENGIIIGSRELREKAEHCDELVASLALAISIALDPSAALGEETTAVAPQAESAPTETVEPPPEPERESAAQEHPPKESRRRVESSRAASGDRNRVQLAARAAFFADFGNAPALAFGFRVGSDLQRDSFRFGAEFSKQFPSSKELGAGGRASASLLAGTLSPCLATDTLAGCGLLSFGSLRTRGESVDFPASQSTFYASVGARFEYTPLLLGKLQLLTVFDAMKPLTPVELHLAGAEVWRTPFLTFQASVGLRFRFR
jgi:hypothetical protein